MTVECIACRSFALRGSDLADNGFGICGLSRQEAGAYVSARYPRDCPTFSAVDAEKERKRREWLDARYAEAKRGLM
jgi:hypothetical protein